MRALLVYPEIPTTFWSFKYALKFIRKRASLPPLGLITVAALLPEHWSLRLVDLNIRKLRDEDLAWADVAFVSAMAIQRKSASGVVRRLRAAGLTVVAGGPLYSCDPAEGRRQGVDHLVLDEAEITLPRFLDDLGRGSAQRVYRADRFADLSETPTPRWDLLEHKRYATMGVQYSRGCPHDCDFCNVTALFGRRARTKSPAQVLAELDALHSAGWRAGVFFVDDNFIGKKRELRRDLLPALIDWRRDRPHVSFLTETTIGLADDRPLMDLMVNAGFDTVFIGIETPEDASLGECGKSQNRHRDLIADVRKIQHAGLEVQGGFIVGFDSDSPNVFERQIAFIQKSGIATAMVGLLQAVPGTRLFDRMSAAGRISGDSTGDNVDGTTNIVPVMSLETLKAGYRRILEHIYKPSHYYRRVRTFLREFPVPEVQVPVQFREVMAFLRSVTRCGVLGRERFQYWQLLFWTLARRRELMPLAIRLAVYGHHFRKVSRLAVR